MTPGKMFLRGPPTGTTLYKAPYKAPSRSSHCRIIAIVRSLLLGIPSVLTSFCSLFFFLDHGVFLVGAFLHLSPSIFLLRSVEPLPVFRRSLLRLPVSSSAFHLFAFLPPLYSFVSFVQRLSPFILLNLLEILFSRRGNYKLSY